MCDSCKSTGLARKTVPTNRSVCDHTSLAGVCPYIINFWSDKNETWPNNILSKSKQYVIITCSCGEDNKKRPDSFSKNRAVKCGKCSKTINLAPLEERPSCNCLELGLARTTKGKNYVCDHYNLLVSCPNIFNFWSIKNVIPANKISIGSHKKVILMCPVCKEEESKTVQHLVNAVNDYQCPRCKLESNSLAKYCPNIGEFWSTKNSLTPEQINRGSQNFVFLYCKHCGTEEEKQISVLSIMTSYNCNNCYVRANNVAKLFPHLINEVNDGTDLSKITFGSHKIISWKCATCGYIRDVCINTRCKRFACRKCSGTALVSYETFLWRMLYLYPQNVYPKSCDGFILARTSVRATCPIHGDFEKLGVLHLHSGCGRCKRELSKLCIEIEKWLSLFRIKCQKEKSFPDLKDKYKLRFDYYFKDSNGSQYLIEADGSQHFRKALWNRDESALVNVIRRDIIKDQYAVNNNIRLVRIPFNMIKNVKRILFGLLLRLNSSENFICTYKYNASHLKFSNTLFMPVKSVKVNPFVLEQVNRLLLNRVIDSDNDSEVNESENESTDDESERVSSFDD